MVQDFLEQAQAELKLDNLDDVLRHIVTEWAQEHLNTKKKTRGRASNAGRSSRSKSAKEQEQQVAAA